VLLRLTGACLAALGGPILPGGENAPTERPATASGARIYCVKRRPLYAVSSTTSHSLTTAAASPGASIAAKDSDGLSPVELAERRGRAAMVVLLMAGAPSTNMHAPGLDSHAPPV